MVFIEIYKKTIEKPMVFIEINQKPLENQLFSLKETRRYFFLRVSIFFYGSLFFNGFLFCFTGFYFFLRVFIFFTGLGGRVSTKNN